MTASVKHDASRPFRRLDDSVLDVFKLLPDATSAVSDVLDELGFHGAVPASTLRPIVEGAAIVGQAVTIRNVPLSEGPGVAAHQSPQLDVVSVHETAGPGDVLVIEGVQHCSNFGGMAALLAQRRGRSGAIIAGGARDISQTRAVGFPMWVRSFTPVSGKNRVRTIALNEDVTIEGVLVRPGDLVVADDTGVCFVPLHRVDEVARSLRDIAKSEKAAEADLRAED